jgi:aspartyl-tRNA synthetase
MIAKHENPYRSHNCNELTIEHVGNEVRLAGWVARKRDHGNLLFVDLRDHYGITQVVAEQGAECFAALERARVESVVSITGNVMARDANNVNPNVRTGRIELRATRVTQLSDCATLPFQVASDVVPPEEQRLTFRYLDLRRETVHRNIMLRSEVIWSLRKRMRDAGFLELQTPILTASSPEGARDFLVPSRNYPGKFFALPQAPQMFKQLFMVSGFDRYFQIAPCFRDEDARADRSPGEFYQLDVEMAFATQSEIFATIEPVLHGVFTEFSDWPVTPTPFPHIKYRDSMLKYGSDKPDLRNPLELCELTEFFGESGFQAFDQAVARGGLVRGLRAPKVSAKPRSFFDGLVEFAKTLGAPGLAYVIFEENAKGPIAKFLSEDRRKGIAERAAVEPGDAVFFFCGTEKQVCDWGGKVRARVGELLDLCSKDEFKFCWVTDYPMFERNDDGNIDFSHNPFSMPQGELEALNTQDPLEVLAYQYDIVCNGVELCSGAVRNHRPEVMVRAFEIAGYTQQDVEQKFGALYKAFQFGAPPHGGLAPGVDRIVQMLSKQPSIREVIAFPLAQNARDLMMNAPSEATVKQLQELHLSVKLPKPPAATH